MRCGTRGREVREPGVCEWTAAETLALRMLSALRVVIVAAGLLAGVSVGARTGVEEGAIAGVFVAMVVCHVGAVVIQSVSGVQLFGRSDVPRSGGCGVSTPTLESTDGTTGYPCKTMVSRFPFPPVSLGVGKVETERVPLRSRRPGGHW